MTYKQAIKFKTKNTNFIFSDKRNRKGLRTKFQKEMARMTFELLLNADLRQFKRGTGTLKDENDCYCGLGLVCELTNKPINYYSFDEFIRESELYKQVYNAMVGSHYEKTFALQQEIEEFRTRFWSLHDGIKRENQNWFEVISFMKFIMLSTDKQFNNYYTGVTNYNA